MIPSISFDSFGCVQPFFTARNSLSFICVGLGIRDRSRAEMLAMGFMLARYCVIFASVSCSSKQTGGEVIGQGCERSILAGLWGTIPADGNGFHAVQGVRAIKQWRDGGPVGAGLRNYQVNWEHGFACLLSYLLWK